MISIKTILDKTKTGGFRLPSFQRDFVWSPKQTSSLIHSLWNESGHIGLITGCLQTDKVKFNSEYFPNYEPTLAHKADDPVFILDGRQRVTSIIKAFEEYSVVVDINDLSRRDFSFQQMKKPLEPFECLKNSLIPLKVLTYTNVELENWLEDVYEEKYQKVIGSSKSHNAIQEVDDEKLRLKNYLQAISRTFLATEITYDPIKFSSPKKAIDHFVIINTAGKTLSNAEIIIAKAEAETGILIKDRLKPYTAGLSIFGMSPAVLLDVLVKCFSAQQDVRYTRYGDTLDFDKAFEPSNLKTFSEKHFPDVKDCFHSIGIPNAYPKMEYPQLFCLIAHTHKNTILQTVSDKQKADRIINKLFTLLALDGFAHLKKVSSGQVPTTLSARIKDIFTDLKNGKDYSDKLDILIKSLITSISPIGHKYCGTTLTLLKDDPVDIMSGEVLKVTCNRQIQFHHIVPKKYLHGCGLESNEINSPYNSVVVYADSNKSIGSKAPAEYLKNISENRERLENLLIPVNDFFSMSKGLTKAVRRNRFRAFLEAREALVKAQHTSKVKTITETQV